MTHGDVAEVLEKMTCAQEHDNVTHSEHHGARVKVKIPGHIATMHTYPRVKAHSKWVDWQVPTSDMVLLT
jgi:hypothetical protein